MTKKIITNRRDFISNSVKGGLAVSIGISSAAPLLPSCATGKNIFSSNIKTGFDQQPLPYKYDALENATEEKWEDVKKAFSSASDSIKEGLKKVTSVFK